MASSPDKDTLQEGIVSAQKALMAGDLVRSEEYIKHVLKAAPDTPDALYILAVLKRFQKDFNASEQTLKHLLTLAPDFARAYQELGHLYRDQGRKSDAINAYRQATFTNPALVPSWKELITLLKGIQNTEEAAQAKLQMDRITTLPKELLATTNYLYEGKINKAEKYCRAYLRKHPEDTEGMRLLAEIANRYGILDEADFLLASALDFDPGNTQVRLDYIQILRKRQKFSEAVNQAKYLSEKHPDNPVFLSHLAIQTMQTGDYEQALALFDHILKILPNDVATHTSRGHALKTLGRQEDAVEAYHRAITYGPAHGDAWYGLANLKTYRFTADEISAMETALASGMMPAASRIQLHFALGKAYEDAKGFDAAFKHYDRGNSLKRAQSRYDPDQMQAEFDAQKTSCDQALFAAHKNNGCPAPDPIFIVGLPRAGSTLLEQILASHSQVDGTMELPNILTLAHSLRSRLPLDHPDGYPARLKSLSSDDLKAFGETYLAETQQHRHGAPFFTDKMPNNFRHIGLIKLILPNARIIDARRNPMDCCFSGYKQLFAEGQEFTYCLESIGRYYRGYVDLMDHWDKILPGEILRVQHEDVIMDLETQVRRILDFCGLPFEQACVDFHQTKRAVKTASSEQVRQKINTKGMDKWKPFEQQLSPLKAALGYLGTE
ncbi:hypothetical protein GCM10017044_28620 [Kordiimonas sediminis]|uniref:Cytochrome c-type biogenesis protein H TPR domain-containing protein n=1 Tax=Kordiimonas sediminis TaxID=1735581 RepID=A0A919AYN0_9PROT|nr:tetratricopeptide repeat-containing sulfotransferase family protein [Kordiimonas sediminis]GHF31358.1 hypothetical protein GCM10017044_28620 [Kordiimonas sediminis]